LPLLIDDLRRDEFPVLRIIGLEPQLLHATAPTRCLETEPRRS
jgi:hypothetical protein